MRKKQQTTPVYLLKIDASTFTHNRPITHIDFCSWTFARSYEFCSLNTGRSVSCKLTVHTGGSSAGLTSWHLLPLSTWARNSCQCFTVTSVSIPVRSPMPWLIVGGSALNCVPCQDQWVARCCQGGELRINSRPLLKTPTSTWRTLGLKNAHSADPCQGCQVGE